MATPFLEGLSTQIPSLHQPKDLSDKEELDAPAPRTQVAMPIVVLENERHISRAEILAFVDAADEVV